MEEWVEDDEDEISWGDFDWDAVEVADVPRRAEQEDDAPRPNDEWAEWRAPPAVPPRVRETTIELPLDDYDLVDRLAGYRRCELCRELLCVFPDYGRKTSSFYADQHALARHLSLAVWKCNSDDCGRWETQTRKAMALHVKRKHPTDAALPFHQRAHRVMSTVREKNLLAELTWRCFPTAIFYRLPDDQERLHALANVQAQRVADEQADADAQEQDNDMVVFD